MTTAYPKSHPRDLAEITIEVDEGCPGECIFIEVE
jgi:hypothetical protein